MVSAKYLAKNKRHNVAHEIVQSLKPAAEFYRLGLLGSRTAEERVHGQL